MRWNIQQIFMTPPIQGNTISSVDLSPEFRIIEYFVIAISLIAATIFFSKKNFSLSDAFRKSIIVAFFTSGLFYAIYADIGWTTWLSTGIKNYGGLSTEQKLEKLDGNLYKFALEARKIITDHYQIYSTNEYMYFRIQYYLLPLVRHEQAPYIVVIADNKADFNPDTRIFTRGATMITNVKPVLIYAQNTYILKRQ